MTTKIAMICVEDVIAAGQDLRNAAPQKWAKPLYEAIRTQFRTVALTRSDHTIAPWWLRKEGFDGWSAVLCWNQVMTYEEWRVDQVRDFLANGWEIAFVLDNNPWVTHAVQELGVLTLQIGEPKHWPGWKAETETPFEPWETVESRVEASP